MKKCLAILTALGMTLCMVIPISLALPASATGDDPWADGVIDITSDEENLIMPPTYPECSSFVTYGGSYGLDESSKVYTAGTEAAESGILVNILQTNHLKVPLTIGDGERYKISFDWENLCPADSRYSGVVEIRGVVAKNNGVYFHQPLMSADSYASNVWSGHYEVEFDFSGTSTWLGEGTAEAGDLVYLVIFGWGTRGFKISNFTVTKVTPPDPWASGIIDVTSDEENLIMPPTYPECSSFVTYGGSYGLDESSKVYTAGTEAAESGILVNILQTNHLKVPLTIGDGERYKISFDWENLCPADSRYSGVVEMRGVVAKNNGVYFSQPVMSADSYASNVWSGHYEVEFDFSGTSTWLGEGTAEAGDLVYLVIFGWGTRGFKISNFTVTKVTPPDPWADGVIDITSDEENLIMPPTYPECSSFVTYGGSYGLDESSKVYTAGTEAAESGILVNILQTNHLKVPLTIGDGERYKISFDWENLRPADSRYSGVVEMRGVVAKNNGVYFSQPVMSADSYASNVWSGHYEVEFDFSGTSTWLGEGTAEAGDLVYLVIFGWGTRGFKISSFTVTKVTPPDPWASGIIDVTSDEENLIIPPTYPECLSFVTYGGSYGLDESSKVYTAGTEAAESGILVNILQTNHLKVPLTIGEGMKYKISFDWENLRPADSRYSGAVEIRGVVAKNNGVYITSDIMSADSYASNVWSGHYEVEFDFSGTSTWLGEGTAEAGDLVYLVIFGWGTRGFKISNFTVTKVQPSTDYDPWDWDDGPFDLTSDITSLLIPPTELTGYNYTVHGGSYSLEGGVYRAETASTLTSSDIMNIIQTNYLRVPLKHDDGEEYTISFNWENTGPVAPGGGWVSIRGVSAQNKGFLFEFNILGSEDHAIGANGKFIKTIDFSVRDPGVDWAPVAPEKGDDIYLYIYGFGISGFKITNFVVKRPEPPAQYDPWNWDDGPFELTSDINSFIIPPTYTAGGDIGNYYTYGGEYILDNGAYRAETDYQPKAALSILQTNPLRVPLKFDAGQKYRLSFNWKNLHPVEIISGGSGYVAIRAISAQNNGIAFELGVLAEGSYAGGETGSYFGIIDLTKQDPGTAAWAPSPERGNDIYLFIYGWDIPGFEISNLTIEKFDGSTEEEDQEFGNQWDFYDPIFDIGDFFDDETDSQYSIVYGHLLDDNYKPWPDMILILEAEDGGTFEATTENDGYFEFRDVPPGHYNLYMIDANGEKLWSGLEFEVEDRQVIRIMGRYNGGSDFTAEVLSIIDWDDYNNPSTGNRIKIVYFISVPALIAVIAICVVQRRKKRTGKII